MRRPAHPRPASKLILTEQQLREQSFCAMFDRKEHRHLEIAAWNTLRWAVLRRFVHEPRDADQIRERFVLYWNKAWGKQVARTQAYWKGVAKCARFARRVFMLLLNYNVSQPFEPYTLVLPNGHITGTAAVLVHGDTRRLKGRALVLSPELKRPRDLRTPDYVSLARWLAMSLRVENTDLAVLHFPLLSWEQWGNPEVNSVLAEQWLNAILAKAALPQFPVPGSWCRPCSHPCRQVTKIPESTLVAADALLP